MGLAEVPEGVEDVEEVVSDLSMEVACSKSSFIAAVSDIASSSFVFELVEDESCRSTF